MTSLVFLGMAVAFSLLGCLVLWYRHRAPRSMDVHIRDFARELDALAPGTRADPHRRGSGAREPRGRRSG